MFSETFTCVFWKLYKSKEHISGEEKNILNRIGIMKKRINVSSINKQKTESHGLKEKENYEEEA